MAATLLTYGFENYIRDALFVALRHGHPQDCNETTVKAAMKLVKILQRKFEKAAKQQLRFSRFYHKSLLVLTTLSKDLKLAYKLYLTNRPDEAYRYVQWARIRHYDIGAYSLAGAAMATALAAVGLATSNKIEIDKIKNFLEQQEAEILELQKQLRQTDDKLEVVTDVQNSMLGYIEEMSTRIDDLNTKVDCFNKHFLYLHWAQELQAEVENLLQFVFLGNINGKLTPTLIRPELLRTFIEKQSVVNANILNRYPNILYSSAMASLLKADFENLQFTYLITFPNFDSEAIYPYLTISQNGFWAKVLESNNTVCLMYKMPNTAVIHNNRLFALNKNCERYFPFVSIR